MQETKGKGPFASNRDEAPDLTPIRLARRCELDRDKLNRLMKYLRRTTDTGVVNFFHVLVKLPPQFRLSLNLKALIGLLLRAKGRMSLMNDGFSTLEQSILRQLIRAGISDELLSVAQELLNAHERQLFIEQFGAVFFDSKLKKTAHVETPNE